MTSEPTLGRALNAWATTEPDGAGDGHALARILGHADALVTRPADTPSRRAGSGPLRTAGWRPGWRPGWTLGGALAASLAVAVLLAPRPGTAPADGDNPVGAPVMLAQADCGETAAFALLYTPTAEEEYQL